MRYREFVMMNEQGASHWWYVARRNLVLEALKKEFPGMRDLMILDVASACGDNFSSYRSYGSIFGLDISWHAICYSKNKNISTIVQADAGCIPYKTGSFDLVLALDILEHLQDDTVSLREISRVLKRNGKLVFNVPACMALFSYHDEAFEHVRRYRINELRQKMSYACLQIINISHWSCFIFLPVYLHRKLRRAAGTDPAMAASDFHTRLPSVIEWGLAQLSKLERKMIQRNINLPFGVSIFGVAGKSERA